MPSSKPCCRGWRPSRDDLLDLSILLACLCGIAWLTSCGGTKVLIAESEGVVRAGPNLKGQVYYWTGEAWELSKNRVTIPEGWFITSLESDD